MTFLAWACVASIPIGYALLEVEQWILRGRPGAGR